MPTFVFLPIGSTLPTFLTVNQICFDPKKSNPVCLENASEVMIDLDIINASGSKLKDFPGISKLKSLESIAITGDIRLTGKYHTFIQSLR